MASCCTCNAAAVEREETYNRKNPRKGWRSARGRCERPIRQSLLESETNEGNKRKGKLRVTAAGLLRLRADGTLIPFLQSMTQKQGKKERKKEQKDVVGFLSLLFMVSILIFLRRFVLGGPSSPYSKY
mmetsp:Transcript_38293/g.75218  ORF Transcript_38293/g.75218 Transcript_38293/m.75218 type:complete len:128 (-) Transcript_38293:61-444(-)